jgi:hypothetical protein
MRLGDLLLDGNIVLSGIDVYLDPVSMRKKGAAWSGSFLIPKNGQVPTLGLSYRLIFDDGYSGAIHIDSVPEQARQAGSVYFTGNGPLQ